MSDQGIWYKLWCSALDDPDLDNLPIADFGRWAKFGAFVKKHGTGGVIELSAPARALCAVLQVENFAALCAALARLPNISLAVTGVTGATVTFRNWQYFQGDNSIERVRKFRERVTANVTDKKRREEKRREEKRTSTNTLAAAADKSARWQPDLDPVRVYLNEIQAPDVFFNPAYWLRIDQWLGGRDSGVAYFRELTAYLAHQQSKNGHGRGVHKDLLAGFRNWLAKSKYWSDQRAERRIIQQRQGILSKPA